MDFSRPKHPHGDACAPGSGHHSAFSLHIYEINHAASRRLGGIVEDAAALCLASDWSLHEIPNAYADG